MKMPAYKRIKQDLIHSKPFNWLVQSATGPKSTRESPGKETGEPYFDCLIAQLRREDLPTTNYIVNG